MKVITSHLTHLPVAFHLAASPLIVLPLLRILVPLLLPLPPVHQPFHERHHKTYKRDYKKFIHQLIKFCLCQIFGIFTDCFYGCSLLDQQMGSCLSLFLFLCIQIIQGSLDPVFCLFLLKLCLFQCSFCFSIS